MEGLYLKEHGLYLDKAIKEAESLALLAKGDGADIMHLTIQKGEIFGVSPGDNESLMEFFYILSGNIECTEAGNETLLKRGDYFYIQGLKDTVNFKTMTNVTMLYVSTQPVFHMLSDEIAELAKISRAIEEKDLYLLEHNDRLRNFALKIAERFQLSKDQLERVLFAALYHDLGKINIPSNILNKPGPLTPEEFDIIKKHPSDGRALIDKTFLKGVGEIVEQHHERLDGTGYPKGLKAEDILFEAKIIAVADTFDALTSDRSYHSAATIPDTMAELKRISGTKLDRLVVEALEAILKEEGPL